MFDKQKYKILPSVAVNIAGTVSRASFDPGTLDINESFIYS